MKTETASQQGQLFDLPADPLRFPCTYAGGAYSLPCRAQPGGPCRWKQTPTRHWSSTLPVPVFHAERRRAAGEPLKTYEELYGAGAESAPIEVEDDAEEQDDTDAEGEP